MEQLFQYLLQFGQLNEQQMKLVALKVGILTLDKVEYFSEAGKISRRIAFVIEGVCG